MRLLGSLSGIAAINISGEQTVPEKGIVKKDLINSVTNRYNFNVSPPMLHNSGQLPILQFQAGSFVSENETIPIAQIIATSDGDAVSAQNTHLADLILTDYLEYLENNFAFRFREWNAKRIYQSYLLVEFDQEFVDRAIASSLQKIVNDSMLNDGAPYAIKRLAFGQDASNYAPPQPTIHQFVGKEFVIERRANELMQSNRFFCIAPLTTDAHIDVLTKMEKAALVY